MNILITGSSGFLGSMTYKYLKNKGYNVYGVDIVPSQTSDYTGDVRSFILEKKCDYEVIYHFAAIVGGRAVIENDFLTMMDNVDIDTKMFRWMAGKCKKIIYPSSSAVYPTKFQEEDFYFLNEKMIDFSTSTIGVSDHLYGWYKLSAERMLWEIHKNFSTDIVVFRPFSGYGPTQSVDYPFPNLIRLVNENPREVVVWGDGNQVRDFIHISDILNFFEMALFVENPYSIINLGTGIGITFNDLIRLMAKTLHDVDDVKIITRPEKPTGVKTRVADTTIQKLHNMIPEINILDGIRSFI